jgi:hypothetical protein
MELRIVRHRKSEKQIIGDGFIINDLGVIIHKFYTLELAWKKNQRSISCIPTGSYNVKKRKSKKYREHFHVLGVEDRSYILIHSGNMYTHTRGCILVGQDIGEINNDGFSDVIHSRDEMKTLNRLLPDNSKLEIK